ncbi:hypothetical protein [Streptomyces ossamyceticus]|uniref:hypothetical protein n=1 Tax=Streptomyces ossamyceticus TaxID=249581 RepID=UPI003428A592
MGIPGDSLETAGLGVPGVGMLPVGVASAAMVTLAVMGAFAAVMASTAVVASAGAVAWTLAATMVVMPSAVV